MKKYIAEFFGTYVLVFFGCGAAIFSNNQLAIAFAFGLSLMLMCYTIGHVSGSHVNPAVTLAFFLDGKMSIKDAGLYWAAQFLGGLFAGLTLFIICALIPDNSSPGLALAKCCNNCAGVNNAIGSGFILEFFLTLFFVFFVMKIAGNKNLATLSGLLIGMALVLVHIVGIPFTGTSVNPARSFGVALFGAVSGSKSLAHLWVFLIAPMLGGAAAFGLNKLTSILKKINF